MSNDRGFVLVNALILVAAMAAVAVFLLAKSEAARVRLQQGQGNGQLTYYLDGFDALAITLLNQDGSSGDAVDHNGETWAKADYNVAVDRGQIAGQITDLQGLYNLNWLTDPTNKRARGAFDQLLARVGVSPQAGKAIVAYLRAGGPENRQAYARMTPPLDPVGGAVSVFDQLEDIPQLSTRDLARLRIHVAALPGDTALNINTASTEILAGFLPELKFAVVGRILLARQRQPFVSVKEFTEALEAALGKALDDSFEPSRFSVGSDWFRVDSSAHLETHVATRTSVLLRQPYPIGTAVRWRKTTRP